MEAKMGWLATDKQPANVTVNKFEQQILAAIVWQRIRRINIRIF